ncbi:marine proteobacterial sortase target protein [Thalassotalea sp. ND16A]|uniref:marine proteobacterial sortase target protein n=1 Tax=Thalassotalea sp. ND16A TaxID=1535422 RepID=UPI00051D4F68|nr:marine proteobacterial sortase target protein [Thalassotalea sp. ND16A]KGK00603.1 NAD(+) ADP-ribosyltransferase [Thalassotalea sp. ND16A]
MTLKPYLPASTLPQADVASGRTQQTYIPHSQIQQGHRQQAPVRYCSSPKYQLQSFALWICYFVVGSFMVHSFVIQAATSVNEYQTNIDYHEVSAGNLYLKSDKGYQHSLVLSSDYVVDVNAMMARVTLTQNFTNTSSDWVEGVYVFPLASDVAVDDMEMVIGERFIKAEIQQREQAQKTYQQAKRTGKKASLVEQQRPNLFTTSVANIPPGESIKIKISYLQQVPLSDHIFSLRLPLTITPRYIPREFTEAKINHQQQQTAELLEQQSQDIDVSQGMDWSVNTHTVPDAAKITPFQSPANMGQQASIKVNLNVGLPIAGITSPYHQINQMNPQRQHHNQTIRLVKTTVPMNRDFVLNWQIKADSLPQAAFFKESKQGYDYGLLMLTPPTAPQTLVNIAKEMIYIIDTSGSMGGVAIKQAKQALAYAVKQLSPLDKFNIIEFNSAFTQLFSQPKSASASQVNTALNWIDRLEANGGTEMLPALKAATGVKASDGYIRQVVFITDGSVGNEAQLFRVIKGELYDSRLHTVGIGSAPNSHFMERAAELGRGSYNYIGKIAEVQQKMAELFNRISQPVLTDIKVNWPNQNVELLPAKIADLYATEPLIISARWPSAEPEPMSSGKALTINVSGKINQQQWQQKLSINHAAQQSGVVTWWARQKIKQLNYKLYDTYDDDKKQSLIEQITAVAIDNRLLSKYTSFVAVDKTPSRKLAEILKSKSVANAMPHGSTQAIPMANTATSANLQLKVGLLMLLITALCMLAKRTQRQYHALMKPKTRKIEQKAVNQKEVNHD